MIKPLLFVMLGSLLAAPALAASERLEQATEQYISTKLDCDNMSRFQKEVCLRAADEAYQQAKAAGFPK